MESDRRPRELGSAGDPISGLWAEVALDGIVLYDPGLTVARRLGEIRHRIAAGEIERREVNGEPYWVGVA